MSSIVLELQRMASEEGDISELLRKALVVASKLKLPDFREWIEKELNGWKPPIELPKYRLIEGILVGQDPFTQLWKSIPWHGDPQIAAAVNKCHIRQPIAELARLGAGQNEPLYFALPPAAQSGLQQFLNAGYPVNLAQMISSSTLDGVIEAVRTTILQWSLKLEEEGIMGKGMTFSDSERHRAKTSPAVHIQNFAGVLGNVSGGKVTIHQQNSSNDLKMIGDFIAKLQSILPELQLPTKKTTELQQVLGGVELQLKEAEPNRTVLRILLGEIWGDVKEAVAALAKKGITAGITVAGSMVAQEIIRLWPALEAHLKS